MNQLYTTFPGIAALFNFFFFFNLMTDSSVLEKVFHLISVVLSKEKFFRVMGLDIWPY